MQRQSLQNKRIKKLGAKYPSKRAEQGFQDDQAVLMRSVQDDFAAHVGGPKKQRLEMDKFVRIKGAVVVAGENGAMEQAQECLAKQVQDSDKKAVPVEKSNRNSVKKAK